MQESGALAANALQKQETSCRGANFGKMQEKKVYMRGNLLYNTI